MQTWYHGLIDSPKPQGWDHQLPTDIVLNYLIQYEKLLVQPSPNLQVIGLLSANVGTLNNNINAGITFRAGIFNDYFLTYERLVSSRAMGATGDSPTYRRFQFYFYMRPIGRLVMDDSILQSGFFTHDSAEHVVDRDLLNRGFVQFEYGTFVGYKRVGVSLSEKLIITQYTNAPSQQVSNLTFFFSL